MSDMSRWSGGYPSDRPYLETVQSGTAPGSIDLAMIVAGRQPPRSGGRFRYADLGCGSAFTLISLAAIHPEAEFVGYDFMPEHVASARAMISEAGLENVTVEEASFADLADATVGDQFDYITLHGVWTWVSPENQEHLTRIFARWLKPGGVAYVGYNAAAGWNEALPIRRIFAQMPRGPSQRPFAPARQAVEAWLALGQNAGAEAVWERLRDLPDSYLAHDLGATHASAIWPDDLARSLRSAKLDFLCPANLIERFDALRFSGSSLDFVREADKAGWGESARDLVSKRTFRADLFTRGAPPLTGTEIRETLRTLTVMAWPPLLDTERERQNKPVSEALNPDIAQRLDAAMTGRGQPLGRVADALDLDDKPALQTVLIALATHQLRVVRPENDTCNCPDLVAGLHAALHRRWRDGHAVPGLASPRLAAAIPLSRAELTALFGGCDPSSEVAKGLSRLRIV